MEKSAPLLFCKIDMCCFGRFLIPVATLVILISCEKTHTPSDLATSSEPVEERRGGEAPSSVETHDATSQESANTAGDQNETFATATQPRSIIDQATQSPGDTEATTSQSAAALVAPQMGRLVQPPSPAGQAQQTNPVLADSTTAMNDSTANEPPDTPQNSSGAPTDSSTPPMGQENATPFVHRYPYTPEEEQYRLWYGWNSIDTFRAAKEREAEGD